jgi:OmcA/MtrC family decaheme c-type cytochrome
VTGGSGGIALEGHPRGESVAGSGTFDTSVPVEGEVAYFGINGDPMVERRVAVDIVNKCDNCHSVLSLHGNNRAENAQLCVMCHNPRNTDIGRRTGVGIDGKLEESIDMKILIHAIHAADSDEHGFRENGIVIYGYGGSANDFSHVRFPGILNDCTTCHNSGTYELSGKWETPLQNGILATTISSGADLADQTDDLYTTPTAAVCSACHDSDVAKAHMEFLGGAKFEVDQAAINTSFESCSVCHGPGKFADLNVVHGIE